MREIGLFSHMSLEVAWRVPLTLVQSFSDWRNIAVTLIDYSIHATSIHIDKENRMGQNACLVSVCPYSYLPPGVGLIQARGPAQHLTAFVIPITGSSQG
jgi:hypothetical protein